MAGVMHSEKLLLFILKNINPFKCQRVCFYFPMSTFWPLIYLCQCEWKCHCEVIGRSLAKCTLF